MPYTDTIAGKSKKVTITAVAQSLEDLIGDPVEADANRVELSYMGNVTSGAPVAFVTEDPEHTLLSADGEAVYAGAGITITKANFANFKILKSSGADFDMWIKQLDSEQNSL